MTKDETIQILQEIGFPKNFSIELYNKYIKENKIDSLYDYIQTKLSIGFRIDSEPLRDI